MLRSSTCSPSRSLGPPGPERDRRLPVARGGELAAPPHGARRPVCQSGRCVGPPLDRPLPDCRQPAAPHTNRFFSRFFHPEADWADSLTISCAGENNWVFPKSHLVGEAVSQLRASGADGTLICPSAQSAPWWHLLRPGTGWAHDVADVVPLGPAADALSGSSGYPELSCRDRVTAGSCCGPIQLPAVGRQGKLL